MAVRAALQRSLDALFNSPILFVPVVALLLLQTPQLVAQSVSVGLANFFALIGSIVVLFVLPFVQGGLIGMADDALTGSTSLATFVREGKRNYVSLFVVTVVALLLTLGVGFVLALATLFGLIALYPGGAGDTSVVGVVVLLILGVVTLVYLLCVFFIQFYPQAIVLERTGAITGLKRSVTLVRTNLTSVFGYSICVSVLGGVVSGLFGLYSLVARPGPVLTVGIPEIPLAGVAVVALIVVSVNTLVGGFLAVFSVAFYQAIAPETAP